MRVYTMQLSAFDQARRASNSFEDYYLFSILQHDAGNPEDGTVIERLLDTNDVDAEDQFRTNVVHFIDDNIHTLPIEDDTTEAYGKYLEHLVHQTIYTGHVISVQCQSVFVVWTEQHGCIGIGLTALKATCNALAYLQETEPDTTPQAHAKELGESFYSWYMDNTKKGRFKMAIIPLDERSNFRNGQQFTPEQFAKKMLSTDTSPMSYDFHTIEQRVWQEVDEFFIDYGHDDEFYKDAINYGTS